jgi:hypothetical protein
VPSRIAWSAAVPAAPNASLLAVWFPWMMFVLSPRWVLAMVVLASRLSAISPALAVCVSRMFSAFWFAMFWAAVAFFPAAPDDRAAAPTVATPATAAAMTIGGIRPSFCRLETSATRRH